MKTKLVVGIPTINRADLLNEALETIRNIDDPVLKKELEQQLLDSVDLGLRRKKFITELNEMIAKQSIKDATIYVEPTDAAIRIRSKWDNHIAFGITKELFEIYDRIAGHIKSV